MVNQTSLIIVCTSVGVVVGILITLLLFFCIWWYKRRSHLQSGTDEMSISRLPIFPNGQVASSSPGESVPNSVVLDMPACVPKSRRASWLIHQREDRSSSASSILRYLYKDIQKATQNFTTLIGQGSFGPVYRAKMPTGEVVAVKVLASDSKQGEKEFQTEVSLLGRLHHRNLVNLVGYCVDKGQRILVYEYMSNGSLEKVLHEDGDGTLNWNERLQIALDISHGIEYLHEGAVPPVVHRDLKTANILLDGSMRAKVADFGLSKEENFDGRMSSLKGTYGYIDPAYVLTNKSSTKSDVYSFGVIIFELITAIHAHKNLMDYVNLGAMDQDGFDEILDKRLVGKCNPVEVRELAKIAYRCLHKIPRKRPPIGEVSQAIHKLTRRCLRHEDTRSFSADDLSGIVNRIEHQHVELSKMLSRNSDYGSLANGK